MTDFNKTTDIPSEINTLERMTFHHLLALTFLYGDQTFPESENNRKQKRITVNIGRAYDGKVYAMVLTYFELDEQEMLSGDGSKKPWMLAQNWGLNTYPAAFRENSPTV